MDKTCSIVQDLLPLYEEDMLREETKEFVDGHLAQCAACRAELDALKADVKPAPFSAQPLRDLKRQLRRKKLTAVLLAVTLALTLATAGFAYLTAPQYLPYSETEWAISRSPSALADDGSAADGLSDLSGAESISVSLLVPVSGCRGHEHAGPQQRQNHLLHHRMAHAARHMARRIRQNRGTRTHTAQMIAHSARRTHCKACSPRRSPRARSSRSTPRIARQSAILRTTGRTMYCSAAA